MKDVIRKILNETRSFQSLFNDLGGRIKFDFDKRRVFVPFIKDGGYFPFRKFIYDEPSPSLKFISTMMKTHGLTEDEAKILYHKLWNYISDNVGMRPVIEESEDKYNKYVDVIVNDIFNKSKILFDDNLEYVKHNLI
jgi:hypothetical protein